MFTQLAKIYKQFISNTKETTKVPKQKKFAVTVTWQDGRTFEAFCLGIDAEDAIQDMHYRNSHHLYVHYRENQIIHYGTVSKLEIGKELE